MSSFDQRIQNMKVQPGFIAALDQSGGSLASAGTKDSEASDVLYLQSLAAPFTIATVPEATQRAFADHGRVGDLLPPDGGNCEEVLDHFRRAGVDIDDLGVQLQREGAEAFDKSWNNLLECIASKSQAQKKAG
jgi:transaldolase